MIFWYNSFMITNVISSCLCSLRSCRLARKAMVQFSVDSYVDRVLDGKLGVCVKYLWILDYGFSIVRLWKAKISLFYERTITKSRKKARRTRCAIFENLFLSRRTMRSRMAKDFFVLRFVKIFLICSWFSVNCARSPTRTRYWHQINIDINTLFVGTMDPSTASSNSANNALPKTDSQKVVQILTPEVIAEQERILQNIQKTRHQQQDSKHQKLSIRHAVFC